MKKSVLAIMVGALCIILSSCQETPEESSVVSKVDGISEAAVCEPLKKGEKRETNVPTHWKFEEKKSNDRVVIQADIKLGEQSIGNLPVIEMQNHELTQEELNGLIDYFTDGEELYMPQMVTKDAYQEVLDRISSKEGSYLQSAYSTSILHLETGQCHKNSSIICLCHISSAGIQQYGGMDAPGKPDDGLFAAVAWLCEGLSGKKGDTIQN